MWDPLPTHELRAGSLRLAAGVTYPIYPCEQLARCQQAWSWPADHGVAHVQPHAQPYVAAEVRRRRAVRLPLAAVPSSSGVSATASERKAPQAHVSQHRRCEP